MWGLIDRQDWDQGRYWHAPQTENYLFAGHGRIDKLGQPIVLILSVDVDRHGVEITLGQEGWSRQR
jgi:hypothetical protein